MRTLLTAQIEKPIPVNKQNTMNEPDPDTYLDGVDDPDDAIPDLSTPYWVERFAKATVERGRPKAAVTKTSVTLRLYPDVLESFRATGKGWQGRMNVAFRKAAGL